MANVKNKSCVERVLALLVLCNLLVCFTQANEQYEIPQPKFKLLKPKGFQVSIPDEDGIQLFAFHGNLNKKMEKMGNGDFSMDIIDKSHGKWIYQNQKLKVRAGDVIYFWVFVIKNGVGYTHEDGIYEVTDQDFNRVSKKIHKLRKRYAHQPFSSSDIYSYSPGYKRYGYGMGAVFPLSPSEFSDSAPLGFGYGHGLPHHHQRGYNNHGSEGFQHSPEYHRIHDSYGPRGPHENYGHGRFHNHHTHAYHGHGHHGFSDHPHHSWGHKHNHHCDWPDSNEDNSEETTTEQSSTEDTSTEIATTKVAVTVTTEADAEVMSTTTVEPQPQIDIRFGATN